MTLEEKKEHHHPTIEEQLKALRQEVSELEQKAELQRLMHRRDELQRELRRDPYVHNVDTIVMPIRSPFDFF